MNDAMKNLTSKQRRIILERESLKRKTGAWGDWVTRNLLPGSVGTVGWLPYITKAHKNDVFAVLERVAEAGVVHLAVSSLSGIRPTWHEMQRIKNELAGHDAVAVEVYPPTKQMVDDADMFHIWVLPASLPFGLHTVLPVNQWIAEWMHGKDVTESLP